MNIEELIEWNAFLVNPSPFPSPSQYQSIFSSGKLIQTAIHDVYKKII